jgi:3-oxoacyl-[acyl-carrier protein] reductase
MTGLLAGKVAVVAGGTRGIGKGITTRLLHDGAVVVAGFRDRADLAQRLVAEAQERQQLLHVVQADLGTMAGVRELFERADELGGFDILVTSAARQHRSTFAETTEDQFDSMFALNVKSVFFAIQEAARRMRPGGRIVSISSAATALAQPQQAAYAASKAAVEQMVRTAAKELAGRGITVNAVSPGLIETEEVAATVRPEVRKQWSRAGGFGRLGRPEDIADVVGFLAGPDARWVTGQNLRATGGAL